MPKNRETQPRTKHCAAPSKTRFRSVLFFDLNFSPATPANAQLNQALTPLKTPDTFSDPRLWAEKYREPDVVWIRSGRTRIDGYPDGADFVVEVTSPGQVVRNLDLVVKANEYAKAGIEEYWIVDPQQRQVQVSKLSGASFEFTIYTAEKTACSPAPPNAPNLRSPNLHHRLEGQGQGQVLGSWLNKLTIDNHLAPFTFNFQLSTFNFQPHHHSALPRCAPSNHNSERCATIRIAQRNQDCRKPIPENSMDKQEVLERIKIDRAICFGRPCIRGTRIWVSLILDLLANGETSETILKEYSQITEADIRACLAYGAEMTRERYIDLPNAS